MFTGIIQAVVEVIAVDDSRLVIQPLSDSDLVLGESVAVNGCCLTLVSTDSGLAFDLSEETLARTNLGDLEPGDEVNVERAMGTASRFGGHFVQGHVDATGTLLERKPADVGIEFIFQIPPEYDRYLIDKGSIAIDGISLTVVEPAEGRFSVWIIPHTIEHTNLARRMPSDRVNIEYDLVGKYVEKLASRHFDAMQRL